LCLLHCYSLAFGFGFVSAVFCFFADVCFFFFFLLFCVFLTRILCYFIFFRTTLQFLFDFILEHLGSQSFFDEFLLKLLFKYLLLQLSFSLSCCFGRLFVKTSYCISFLSFFFFSKNFENFLGLVAFVALLFPCCSFFPSSLKNFENLLGFLDA